MKVHKHMIERLANEAGLGLSLEVANNAIKLEIERICRNILDNTAVYKDTETGTKGIINFMNSNGFELI